MSVQVKRRRDTATNISTFTPATGELIVDTTNNRVIVGDGSTVGGFAAAKLSETVRNNVSANNVAAGANGAIMQDVVFEQTLSLSGPSSTAATPIPQGATVFAVGARVITAITGPTSFEVGVSGTPAQFSSGGGLTLGSIAGGAVAPTFFAATTSIVVTGVGGSFSGGAVRLSTHYRICAPPTS